MEELIKGWVILVVVIVAIAVSLLILKLIATWIFRINVIVGNQEKIIRLLEKQNEANAAHNQ